MFFEIFGHRVGTVRDSATDIVLLCVDGRAASAQKVADTLHISLEELHRFIGDSDDLNSPVFHGKGIVSQIMFMCALGYARAKQNEDLAANQ